MKFKQLAADTRDPVAALAFGILFIVGSLGLIPEDADPNVLAEIVGAAMGLVAAIFSYLHRREYGPALRAGFEARERYLAEHARFVAPTEIPPDDTAPDGIVSDGQVAEDAEHGER
jgi:hypothetical protein